MPNIRAIAATNAAARNSMAACCSSASPLKDHCAPSGRPSSDSSALSASTWSLTTAGRDVGFDDGAAGLVHPSDRAGPRSRCQVHEVLDGHKTGHGRHPEAAEFGERPLLGGKPHPNWHRLVGVGGPVLRDLDPLGQKLHGLPEKADIRSET